MQITSTQQINAPIDDVFRLLTDPEQVRRWIPTLESTETVSTPDDGGVVGTRFRNRIRNANSSTSRVGHTVTNYDGVITEFDPPSRFAVRVGSSVILLETRYELSRGPGDSTDLQCITEFRVTHWLLRWFGWFMNKAIQLGMTQHLQSLKRVAEADAR